MKIISLVENYAINNNNPKHGLSLYLENKNYKILFDLGPDKTLFENAKMNNVDLSLVDIVIISHGHFDHGGALEEFLRINKKAKVYIQRSAFDKFYTKFLFFKINIGLDYKLKDNERIVLVDGDYQIDDNLVLCTTPFKEKYYSKMNKTLLHGKVKDKFEHEQNLLIKDKKLLIMGCGHAGVVNILEKVNIFDLKYVVGGFHFYNPVNKKTVCNEFLDKIINELDKYNDTIFYTCHCTGIEAFNYLNKKMSNINYLYCGQTIYI